MYLSIRERWCDYFVLLRLQTQKSGFVNMWQYDSLLCRFFQFLTLTHFLERLPSIASRQPLLSIPMANARIWPGMHNGLHTFSPLASLLVTAPASIW